MKKSLILLLAVSATFMVCASALAHRSEGLVAYYPFNGNADDESGNTYNGIVAGADLTDDAAGNAQGAYEFDGNGEILIPGTEGVEFPAYTFTAWIVNKTPSGIHPFYILYRDKCFGFYTRGPEKLAASIYSTNKSGHAWETRTLTGNTWKFVAAVFDENLVKLFIDGELVKVDSHSKEIFQSGKDITIGSGFVGTIDEVRIFNQALSDMEIKDLYNTNAPVPPEPVCYNQSQLDDARESAYENGRQAAMEACRQDPASCGITCASMGCEGGTDPVVSDENCASAAVDIVGSYLDLNLPCVKLAGSPDDYYLDMHIPLDQVGALLSTCNGSK